MREVAKVAELPTERTAIRMMALKIEGRARRALKYQHRPYVKGLNERRLTFDTGILDSDNEGRGSSLSSVQQSLVVVRYEEADQKQRDDVEERHAPEDLLGRSGESLSWVVRLGGGETDEFGAGVREGCRDEDGAETLESV